MNEIGFLLLIVIVSFQVLIWRRLGKLLHSNAQNKRVEGVIYADDDGKDKVEGVIYAD
jgi:hypothetical protein